MSAKHVFQPPVFPNFAYNLVSSLLQFSNILIVQDFHNKRNNFRKTSIRFTRRRKGFHPISPPLPLAADQTATSYGTLLISSAEQKGADQPLRVSTLLFEPSLHVVRPTLLSSGGGEKRRSRKSVGYVSCRVDFFLVFSSWDNLKKICLHDPSTPVQFSSSIYI